MKTTYIAFVDLEKAFDKVKWRMIFNNLERAGITYKDRRIIKSLYEQEIGVIRCGNYQEETKIMKGVRQECTLSPSLFNLYL